MKDQSEHYTDRHSVERGSSLDIIERCGAFLRQAADFEGILDYAEDEANRGEFQQTLRFVTDQAYRIIARESGPRNAR